MKTTRDRAEDCVSYWNPSNFKGRSLIVDAVERSIKQAIDDARAAGYAEAIEAAIAAYPDAEDTLRLLPAPAATTEGPK